MASTIRFEKLMQPGYIGKVQTRNRIIKTATGTGLIEKEVTVGKTMIDFYENLLN